jgi:aspartyl/glutamyl-tRNA(Asn/Gln) amidotransferase C subunit
MRVTAAEVARIAALAELAVDPAELPRLTEDLERILDFVARLPEPSAEASGDIRIGAERLVLRDDVVLPSGLARPPADFAPEFVDGFFVVPRLEAMEDA